MEAPPSPTQDITAHENRIHEMFTIFDPAGSGKIRSEDVGYFLRALGLNPSDRQIEMVISECDIAKKGSIDCATFQQAVLPLMSERTTSTSLINAFRVFDKDGCGKISTADLRYIATNVGEALPTADIEDLLRMADKEGRGEVDYHAFVAALFEGE